jgi:hypothetical protein
MDGGIPGFDEGQNGKVTLKRKGQRRDISDQGISVKALSPVGRCLFKKPPSIGGLFFILGIIPLP